MVEEEIGGSGRRKLGFDETEEEMVVAVCVAGGWDEMKSIQLLVMMHDTQIHTLTFIIITTTMHSLAI